MRSEGGQRKYNAMLEAQAQGGARAGSMYIQRALAIVVVLVALIGVGVQAGRAKITGDVYGDERDRGERGGVREEGRGDGRHVRGLPVPALPGRSRRRCSSTLEADVRANQAQLRYHTMSFLDATSNGNKYSSRAANAALCVSDVSRGRVREVPRHPVHARRCSRPRARSGRSDNDLVAYAQQTGLTPAQVTTFTTCMQTEQHKALVQAITDNASKRGINSTPTVLVNGK